MIRIKNPTPARLPNEYQEVEYLESTGTQYIDTGYAPYKTTTELKFQKVDGSNTNTSEYMCAVYNTNNNRYYVVMLQKNAGANDENGFHIKDRYNEYTGETYNYDTNIHTVIYNDANNKTWFDGVENMTVTDLTTQTSRPIFLYCMNGNSGFQEPFIGRIYYCKITDKTTNTLVRDFVPCYRKSDNEPGMYDLVNGTFYTNAGNGTFLIGNEVGKRDLDINPAIFNLPIIRGYAEDKLFYGEEPQAYEQLVNYTMLYDRGDECAEITGGWNGLSAYNNAKATKNSDHFYMHASTASFTTKSKVDLTSYAKVYAFCKNASIGVGGWVIQVADALVNKNGLGIDWEAGIWTRSTANGNYLANLDVTSITSPQYCSVRVNDNENNAYLSIYNIFITKQDNWQELCTKAGLNSSSYSDEKTLCANSTAIATILSNKEAVEYMIYNCTGSFMAEFIASSTCLTALNNSAYNTTIQANEHWNKFLSMVA